MKITCPHCGARRVTLLLDGKQEHGVMVEHLVPESDTIKTTAATDYSRVMLDVRPSCEWSNALVRVS